MAWSYMEDTPTVAAARRFLELVRMAKPHSETDLARALDELAIAYHEAPEGAPAEEDRDPPADEFQKLRHHLVGRFPELGMYAVADPVGPLDGPRMAGDAIDDLADIARDLEEVLWRFEHLGPDDAHWHFKLLYRIHWGRHLRELSLYLHARLW